MLESKFLSVNRFNWTEEELHAYEEALKRQIDYMSKMQTAEEKGFGKGEKIRIEKGIAEGEKKRRLSK